VRVYFEVMATVAHAHAPPPVTLRMRELPRGTWQGDDRECFETTMPWRSTECTVRVGTGWDSGGARTIELELRPAGAAPVDVVLQVTVMDPHE
jgi:hypothetical protein